MEDRSKLPFRKNCEGYFFDGKGNVLAKEINGILMFPGGGVDEEENVEETMIRETFEETGAKIASLNKVGELKFVWGSNWAVTDKQKKRYNEFQGEDMVFFEGEIEKFEEPENNEEDFWKGEKLMLIENAINFIKSLEPFDESIKPYREFQLKFLESKK